MRSRPLSDEKAGVSRRGRCRRVSSAAGPIPAIWSIRRGWGANPYKHPLHLDSRHTGQTAPIGFTPYGNVDLSQWHDNGVIWPITYYLGAVTVPDAYRWPTPEAFFDVYLFPMMTEFTVDSWAPNVYVWGYLAAR